jgi:hypothetical protein
MLSRDAQYQPDSLPQAHDQLQGGTIEGHLARGQWEVQPMMPRRDVPLQRAAMDGHSAGGQ